MLASLPPALLAHIAECPAARAERWAAPLCEVMARYDIIGGRNEMLRASHFLAQVLHESGRLRYTREVWGPTRAQQRYEGRADLGNVQPGDGYRFRGRGLVQLTGRLNYRAASAGMRAEGYDIDFEERPDLVAEEPWAALVAGWYWAQRGLNAVADRDDARTITRKINGGYNGLADRMRLLERAKAMLCAHLALKAPLTLADAPAPAPVAGATGRASAEAPLALRQALRPVAILPHAS